MDDNLPIDEAADQIIAEMRPVIQKAAIERAKAMVQERAAAEQRAHASELLTAKLDEFKSAAAERGTSNRTLGKLLDEALRLERARHG